MKFIINSATLILLMAFKVLAASDVACPGQGPLIPDKLIRPVYSFKLKNKDQLFICGKTATENMNFQDFYIYQLKKGQLNPYLVFKTENPNDLFLVAPMKDRFKLIEKINVNQKVYEMFARDINCEGSECKVGKEECIFKTKGNKKIKDLDIKDSFLSQRLTKAGCL